MAYKQTKSSEIADVQYLSHGEHSNVRVTDISAGLKKRKNSEEEDDVCDVLFRSIQGQYQLRVFNPDNDEDEDRREKNQEYIPKLFAYILKKLKNKEIEVPAVNSFKELCDWFIKEAGDPKEYSKVSLELKLVGNVYNGKATVGVTRYFGWLERSDSGKKVKFSANEISANATYDKFLRDRQPSTGGEGGGTSGGGGDDLVF